MTAATLVRNPFFAGVFGVVLGVSSPTLSYALGGAAGRTAAAEEVPPAVVTPSRRDGGGTVVLPDFSALVRKFGPAVVNIRVVEKRVRQGAQGNPIGPNSPFAPFFRGLPFYEPYQPPMRGEGSGFIIEPDGVVLTNAHVVADASNVTVQLTDGREFAGKVIGLDKVSDIAVVKIQANELPTVSIGNSRAVEVGQWVLAIGAPFGLENSATAGIVSAKERLLPESGYVPFIQTDVPINPGNSGGPLFNMNGQVIGINSQIYSHSGGYMGVSFSIPIDVAMNVARQLLATGQVRRGWLGVTIQPVNQGLADSFGLPAPEGALVSSLQHGGAAAQGGIQPGDVILAVNGQPIRSENELPVRIASLLPSTIAHLTIWRDHQVRHINVRLGSMSAGGGSAVLPQQAQHQGGTLGLVVRPLTPSEREQAHTHDGLLVEEVAGAAQNAGIQPGDIVLVANGQPVSSVERLRSAVERSHGHVALLIQRGASRIFVPVSTASDR
jgi:serine protease Do